jgi:hypothetical protein
MCILVMKKLCKTHTAENFRSIFIRNFHVSFYRVKIFSGVSAALTGMANLGVCLLKLLETALVQSAGNSKYVRTKQTRPFGRRSVGHAVLSLTCLTCEFFHRLVVQAQRRY